MNRREDGPAGPNPGADLSRAQASHQAGRLAEATAVYLRMLEDPPSDPVLCNNLGIALAAVPRLDEACRAFELALSLDPSFSEARNNLGLAHRAAGRLDQACAEFRRIIANRPRFAPAYYNLVRSKQMGADDPEPAAIAEMLEQPAGLDDAARTQLHFALGKAEDDADRPEAAIQQFAAGNALWHRTHTYDLGAAIAAMAAAGDAYDPAGPGPDPVPEGPVPIFVVGLPRSGTSLVEQILSCHPDVFGAGEATVLPALTRTVGERLGAGRAYPGCLSGLSAAERGQEGQLYLDRLGARVPAPAPGHVVDKLPSNFLRLGWIATTLPQARIVHCVRDPRDVGLSCFQTLFEAGNGFAYDLADLGRYYGAYAGLMRHWSQVLTIPIHEVRYETLVKAPEPVIRALLDALGLDWDPEVLEFHKADRPVLTASASQVRRPLYDDAVGRWRRYERHLGPLVKALAGAGVALEPGS